jgi:RHS repeat-associated protein
MSTNTSLNEASYVALASTLDLAAATLYASLSNVRIPNIGQMRDGESTAGTDTGQDYFNARYFWANTARFTSPDAPFADQRPEDGQSWNMYAYVRNNPLRYVDPSGERAEVTSNCRDEEGGTVCQVTIRASVALYAAKDSNLGKREVQRAAAALKKETEAAWSGSFVGKDGAQYIVSTSVTTSIVDSEQAAIQSGADNVVGVTRGDAMSGGITSYVQDRHRTPFSRSDRGVFSFEALTAGRNTGAHEMGHFFGGRDLFAGDAIMNKDPHKHSPRMTPHDFNRVLWPTLSKGPGSRTVRAVWSARLGF